MVDITVAVIEDAIRVELESVARDSDRYWAIIKLIDEGPAVAFLNVTEGSYFETATVLFACVGNARDG